MAETAVVDFDMPSMPLQKALEQYSMSTGWSVLYQGALAEGRVSNALEGRFTPDAGLRMLIDGSGLTPQHSGTDRVVLLPAPAAAAPGGARMAVPAAHTAYYGAAQASLREVFCADPGLSPGEYRVALRIDIGLEGRVRSVRLLDTTNDAARDAAITDAISRMVFAAPPADMPQPLVLLILPKSLARSIDCPKGQGSAPTHNGGTAYG